MDSKTIINPITPSQMFFNDVIRPIFSFVYGWTEHAATKALLVAGGLAGYLSLDLFATPTAWWKTLTYLVLIDWASGSITALVHGDWDWRLFTTKCYKITGYIMCCSAAALIANAMPEVFYYAQFAIYAAFFAREFHSILRIWKVWAFFIAIVKTIFSGKSYTEKFHDFTDAIEHEHKTRNKKKGE